MILENAFGYLPEILTGSNYAAQAYEGGIVTAVALAVLQELNARNVPNPLSNICVEKLYDMNGFDYGADISKKRYLRADMYVDLSRMWVGSKELAKFGWRHKNWLEAKYFRKDKLSSTTACTHIAADLIRLCTLVSPESQAKSNLNNKGPVAEPGSLNFEELCTGRYFLHVYDSDPEGIVGKGRNRSWLKQLRSPGKQHLSFKVEDDKAKKDFVSKIGEELKSIEVNLTVTNFCREQNPTGGYFCVLSRIDEYSISMKVDGNIMCYEEKQSRTGNQNVTSAFVNIRNKVGSLILLGDKQSKDQDDEPPSEYERAVELLERIDSEASDQ
ncbi:MAG: hypothetical protein HGA87_04855 [Desulfobulbaceae bacterium]|nr:hypothetical protein [Desulfobulbaceae bacterium]